MQLVAQSPISLTILRRGDMLLVDVADLGSLIPRSETQVDEEFLHALAAEVSQLATPGYGHNRAHREAAVPPGREPERVVQELQRIGGLIFSHLFTDPVRTRLRTAEPCDVYLRLDEQLLQVPWELGFDGESFLATKFRIGRQVITGYPLPATRTTRITHDTLKVLLIADPTQSLPQAQAEAEQLYALLDGIAGVEVTLMGGKTIRKLPLLAALQDHEVVHFAGHSEYDPAAPHKSGWRLHEGILTAAELSKLTRPPLLVFSNSCEAGTIAGWEGGYRYEGQAFGIGSAFLLAGVQNYIGTFWVVHDEESVEFAVTFYRSLAAGQTLGAALHEAHQATLTQSKGQGLTWASYMLYGNPTTALLPGRTGQPHPLLSSPDSAHVTPPGQPTSIPVTEDSRELFPPQTEARTEKSTAAVPSRLPRKLTAILSADVKGYSRLMGEDEEATIRILTAYRKLMSTLIQHYRGRVVDAPGDNLLAEFVSAVDAVQCAVEIQKELQTRNAELPDHRQMQYRIGINVGDVISEGERLYGDGVNIAARLEAIAEGGGICLSGTVYDQVKNKLALKYENLGEQTVKNIAEPVRVYRVLAALPPTPPSVPSSEFRVPSSPPLPAPSPQPSIPTLVGREPELAQLHQLLDKAMNGERQVVFVTGEPGIGKTTLLEVFLAEVGAALRGRPLPGQPHEVAPTPDPWITHGQCIEQHGAGEAFLPVLDALGRLARGAGGAQLIELLRTYAPMWLVQLPAFLDGEERETLQRKVQGASRERMLREFAEMVEALTTGEEPGCASLLLVLEDLHWSDVSTLDLLAFIARRKEPARLLVIGTYRPVEMLNDGHPLQGITQELYAHRLATELALGVLSEADIAAYLDERFNVTGTHSDDEWCHSEPQRSAGEEAHATKDYTRDSSASGLRMTPLGADGGSPFRSLARMLHHRTGGNPLFLVSTVEELVSQGHLTQTDHSWTWQGEVAEVGIANSIRHLVARQSGRLSADERQTLEAASVAGMEFSAAAVAAALTTETSAMERRCEQLAKRQLFLRRVGIEAWPDGTLAARYGFLHALYQHLWHERVSPTQLQAYHRQIGERKERAYGDRAREIATELAMHFEQGRDYRRAIQYLQHAAENTLRRSANIEAISHLTKGLELLKTLPGTPKRTQQELTLQITLGGPLMATKGYAAPEVEQACSRALELCRHMGETPQLFSVLGGLFAFYTVRAEHKTAHELADQCFRLAQSEHNPTLLTWAHDVLGQTLFCLGELALAREHLEQGIALYDPQKHNPLVSGDMLDPGVHCLSYVALALWLLGCPDRALRRSQENLTLAQELSHPFSLGVALDFTAVLHQLRREGQAAQEHAEAMIALSTEQGFEQWLAEGTILRGWALAEQGHGEEGIAQMRKGLVAYRATGAEIWRPCWLALLAEVYGEGGQAEEGLNALAEALHTIHKTGERFYEAELYRLKGELTLKSQVQGPKSKVEGEAEECFCQALGIARRQSAKSLELRAVMSLSRLWQKQGKKEEARQMLAEVYGWFTEGFDTKDLQEAKALLDALEDQEVKTPVQSDSRRGGLGKKPKKGAKPK